MKFKGYILSAMALVMAGMTFAAEPEFHQFTRDDFNIYNGDVKLSEQWNASTQEWIPASMITLKVTAGSTVYLTNKVSSWHWGEDLGVYQYGYDMSADDKYGYVIANVHDGTVSPTGNIHYADGTTKDITYQNPTGPETFTTKGYLLGTFEDDAEIFLVMTPTGANGTVNSYDPVNDPDGKIPYTTILASREIGYDDQAGNVVFNFGVVDDANGHEFVIGYIGEPPKPPVAGGQPLPGVLLAGLLSLGSVTACKKMKKRN